MGMAPHYFISVVWPQKQEWLHVGIACLHACTWKHGASGSMPLLLRNILKSTFTEIASEVVLVTKTLQ